MELKEETGCHITFINLSGGVGVPYRPEQPANDIAVIGEGVRRAYEEVLVPAGMGDVAICTGLGRFLLAPYGCRSPGPPTRSTSTRSTSGWTPAQPT